MADRAVNSDMGSTNEVKTVERDDTQCVAIVIGILEELKTKK